MGSSSRAPPPARLYTTASGGRTMMASPPTVYDSTPRSAGTESSYSSSFRPPTRSRTDSGSTTSSSDGLAPGTARKVSTPNVNVHTHCGRHSNQYLFGGWGPIVKSVFHKKN